MPGGSGWGSNPPRPATRPATGVEDREALRDLTTPGDKDNRRKQDWQVNAGHLFEDPAQRGRGQPDTYHGRRRLPAEKNAREERMHPPNFYGMKNPALIQEKWGAGGFGAAHCPGSVLLEDVKVKNQEPAAIDLGKR
jgi:hypothetical protein